MATPLGHAFCGVLVGSALNWQRPLIKGSWREAGLFAALALAPDLDFIPGIIMGQPSAFHHGISHSVGFAALLGGVMALIGRRWRMARALGLTAGLIYAAQVGLDALYADYSPPHGVPLLWPFDSGYFIMEPPWLPDVRRSPLNAATVWHNLRLAGIEALFLGLPALAVAWLRARRQKAAALNRSG